MFVHYRNTTRYIKNIPSLLGNKSSLTASYRYPYIVNYNTIPVRYVETPAASEKRCRDVLFRDYIFESLYNREKGYFMNALRELPLKESFPPISFQELQGFDEYISLLKKLYQSQSVRSWITPVELFRPWYGFAIARWIEQVMVDNFSQEIGSEWHVIEVGGGNGTLAESILQYASNNYSKQLYHSMHYHIVEISPLLAQRQAKRLSSFTTFIHIHTMSITEWQQVIQAPCIVLFCEVLDNFPHDRIEFDFLKQTWYECYIRDHLKARDSPRSNSSKLVIRQPLQDILILSTMNDWNMFSKQDRTTTTTSWHSFFSSSYWFHYLTNLVDTFLSSSLVIYVPTVAQQVFQLLHRCLPRAHLFIADFDMLPQATRGMFAPVVQGGNAECIQTFASIEETTQGSCDILFPVNFNGLSHRMSSLWHHANIKLWKQGKFLKRYAPVEQTTTKSGYNPMLEDFKNTSILTSYHRKEF
eukprot:jgi/Galph1/4081/GphlegSOOS_G2748.1